MKRLSAPTLRRRSPWLYLALLSLCHCGVEAGNPGDDTKPKTGVVNIHFARAVGDGAQSLELSFDAIELRAGTGDTEVASALTSASAAVDLFGLTGESATDDEDDVLAASSDAVPVGTYERIVVTLAASRPVRYKDAAGTETDVSLATTETRSFYVQQSIDVLDGETTDVVIDLDARRSLVRGDGDGPLVFRPRGEADRRRGGVAYGATTTEANAAWVCAYLYAAEAPQQPIGPPSGHGDGYGGSMGPPPGDRPPPPPPGPVVDPKPSFVTKADVVKDTTAECPNAHERTPVAGGAWRFPRLRPGTYDFRLFRADDTWLDIVQDVKLTRPDHDDR